MLKFTWRDWNDKEAFGASRHKYQTPSSLHRQDFAEICWIEGGHGVHRVNGTLTPLRPGSLIMIRPKDCHGFSPARGETISLTNIAFPRAIMDALQKRYFPKKPVFFWSRERLPFTKEMDSAELQQLNNWADRLSQSPREAFYIDWFLLNVFGELSSRQEQELPADAPGWLVRACAKFPEQLETGVEGFFRLCGRSHSHVSRVTDQYLKMTPTAYVNKLRMAYARHQLEMGDLEILDIMLDCGLENLSHFYTLFRKDTGTTPRAYRLRHRRHL